MAQEPHWTEESSDAFAHRLAFDFIAQIEKRMETVRISQAELARRLKISEGAVSKLLNNPQNLTLRTIAKYSRALGIKASIVAYDDGDFQNIGGPITSEVFTTCWERAGKPQDLWTLKAYQLQQSATTLESFTLSISSKTTGNVGSLTHYLFGLLPNLHANANVEYAGPPNALLGTYTHNKTMAPVVSFFPLPTVESREY